MKLPQMKFFLEKQLKDFHVPINPFHSAKFLKKFLEPIQSYEDVPFLGPKWYICPEQFFFLVQNIITFIYLLALFIVRILKKNLTADLELWGCTIFGPKMVHLPHIFLEKNTYHFHLPIGPFHCAKFKKKFLQRIQSHEDVPFLVPKWSIFPKQIFFLEKIINIVFIYLLAPFIVQIF